MKRQLTWKMIAPASILAAVLAHGCASQLDVDSEESNILIGSGYGHYCSMSWPDGGWAFSWDSSKKGDPCGWMEKTFDPGGTIERAGIYSLEHRNNVVVRCAPGFVSNWAGYGDGPMVAGFNSAEELKRCVFTVAPAAVPIFNAPFDLETGISPGTGVDFARALYPPVLGMTKMNNHGQDRSNTNYIDDHDAYDWGLERGTPIYAVASGVVLDSRWLDTGCEGSDSPIQGEVYLSHNVTRSPSTYSETFVSSYFHLEKLVLEPGQWINQGDLIGYSGNTGCSSGPHLHFATMRLSNTAREYRDPLKIFPGGNDGFRIIIDPYGFDAPNVFDPWSWQAYSPSGNWPGGGALSIDLWREGQAPPTGGW